MKKLVFQSIYLLLFLTSINIAHAGRNNPNQENSIHHKQNNNPMKKNVLIVITVAMALTFGLQMATAQETISADAQSYLDEFSSLKTQIEKGEYKNSDFEKAYDSRAQYVKYAVSKEDRQKFLQQRWLNDTERKKMGEALDAIAKSASSKGVGAKKEQPAELGFDPVFTPLLEEVNNIIKQVNDFDPAKHTFMVTPHDQQWLMRAISKRERDSWAPSYFGSLTQWKDIFLKKMDELSASAARKIPTFKPNPKNFANHNAADEAMMKKQLDDPDKIKIHQIGLAQANWDIQKNKLDVPQKRYKAGYIWGKDSRDDFEYCRLYQVNIIQDYIGGGQYGASYAVYLESWIVGCP